MSTFSRSDFKDLFRGKYDHVKWIDAMRSVFGPIPLKKNPEELEIGLKGNDRGWFLGRFTAASQGGDMEVGVFRYRIESKSVLKSRVGLRNLVRPYVRDYSSLGAALVVFEDAKTGDWRFSFVSDLKGGETAAKRYTYVFGDADGVYNTPADRFAKLAEGRPADGFVTFEQMREAFSVEALSKEFYNRLFAWYQWAMDEERIHVTFPNKVGDLLDDRKGLNVAMIRMLTRILFCWFIKQKKLVPDELFDVCYLKGILRAFEHEKHEEFDPLSATQGTYYNAILQNLFFATLNREIIDDDGKRRAFANAKSARDVRNLYRYREMFKFASGEVEKKVIALFAKVPFLNGGLFECLDKFKKFDLMQDDDVYLDGFSRNFASYKVGKHRHYRYIAHVPNVLFFSEDEKELGLINLLKAYNFTIEENASNDAEVSLDPELLGRVFENLLADYNEETQKSARNATGSFYTPREIVDYQVAESLCAYLTEAAEAESSVVRDFVIHRVKPANAELCRRLEEALLKVKILDPACGSGAYPMGCLLRIVDLIDCLRDGKCDHYALKLKLIDKAIYGIDIQPIAMLITKLRFFISLICDQKEITDDEKTNFGVKPLPNLETKFVAANSLISLETNDMFELEDKQVSTLRQQLLEVRERHFAASTTREKKKLRGEDEQIRGKMIKRLTEIASKPDKQKLAFYKQELGKLEKSLKNLDANGFEVGPRFEQTSFFDEPEASKQTIQTEFPISAAYEKRKKELARRIKDLKNRIGIEEGRKMTTALKEDASNLARWNPYDQNDVAGFFDPYWMFGLKTGFDIVIGNPPYIQLQANGGRLAKLYENKGFETFDRTGDIYCLFYERGHKLLAEKGTLCYITSDKWMRNSYGEPLRKYFVEKTDCKKLVDFSDQQIFEAATVETNILLLGKEPTGECHPQSCSITERPTDNLIALVERQAQPCVFTPTESWAILSPLEAKVKAKVESLGKRLKSWDVSVNLGVKTGLNPAFVIDEEVKAKLILQDPKSADLIVPVVRGRDVQRYYCNQNMWLIDAHNGVKDKSIPRVDVSKYPAVKKFLDQFKDKLQKRGDKGDTPYNLRDCAYWGDLGGPKIIWGELSDKAKFVLSNAYLLNTCFFMVGEKLSYILGLLNSRLVAWYFGFIATKSGMGTIRWYKGTVEQLPIVAPTAKQERQVSDLVDRILAAKKTNPDADTSALESEIDRIVYRLYDLTPEEIAVVESSAK